MCLSVVANHTHPLTLDNVCTSAPLQMHHNDLSEHYRRAHARDGINEMHPYVLNRRISHQESEEMQTAAAQAAAFAEVAMSVRSRVLAITYRTIDSGDGRMNVL